MAATTSHRVLQVAFVTSLAIHTTLILARWPAWTIRPKPPAPQERLTLTPAVDAHTLPSMQTAPWPAPRAERPDVPLPPTSADRQVSIVERLQRPAFQVAVPEVALPQERPDKPDVPAVIDLSNLAPELEHNRAYLEYFRTLRERIRRQAQRNFPPSSRGGEVFVSFVLNATGRLEAVQVDPSRSSADATLRRASLDSVQQAAPFPPFPSTFRQSAITFHIIIAYEINP